MPIFGGTRGSEWTTSLNELKMEFTRYLQRIKDLNYDILDFKITKWHDDYGQTFKEQVKSIENIYNTTIMMTFKYVSTIQDAVEMLENFYVLAKRPTVIEFVQVKAAAEVYRMFNDEMKEVRDLFDITQNTHKNKRPPMPYSHAKYSGMAIWVKSLIQRIDKTRDLLDQMNFIPKHEFHDKSVTAYNELRQNLDDHIAKVEFENWQKSFSDLGDKGETKDATETLIDASLQKYFLTSEVMKSESDERKEKSKDKKADAKDSKKKKVIEKREYKSAFDTRLLKILLELQYWNKLQSVITIPHTLGKLGGDSERLRVLRENVMLIVRDYNNIIVLIDERERKLFDEHITQLNKMYDPGFRKH